MIKKTSKSHSLSLTFESKAQQLSYLKDNKAKNIKYSGKTHTFYFDM